MDTRGFTPEQRALYVVATPIGNLSDLTIRANDILRTVGMVAAEDTRVTATLLRHLGVQPDVISLHAHNELSRIDRIVAHLQAGGSCALVSDAGTPAVSDPGARVVAAVRAAGLRVVPVPGASSVTTLLSAAGLDADRFGPAGGRWFFEGFLPARAGHRRKRLAELAQLSAVLVLMEGPHRIAECLDDLLAQYGDARIVVIGRELTKRFEQIVEMPLGDAARWLQADSNHQRGEFVIAVAPPRLAAKVAHSSNADNRMVQQGMPVGHADTDHDHTPDDTALTAQSPLTIDMNAGQLMQALLSELPPTKAARIARQLTGRKQSELYDVASSLPRAAPRNT